MVFKGKPFSSIGPRDILDLLNNQVPEGRSIDYKGQLPANADEDKREFLADPLIDRSPSPL